MAWSRNLGTLKTAEVAGALDVATAHARGVLSAEEKAKLAELREQMLTGDLAHRQDAAATDSKNRLKHLTSVAKIGEAAAAGDDTPHAPEEVETMSKAAIGAAALVEAMGGSADVFAGGSHRNMPDGTTQTSITITVAVTSGKPKRMPVSMPAQQTIAGPGPLASKG